MRFLRDLSKIKRSLKVVSVHQEHLRLQAKLQRMHNNELIPYKIMEFTRIPSKTSRIKIQLQFLNRALTTLWMKNYSTVISLSLLSRKKRIVVLLYEKFIVYSVSCKKKLLKGFSKVVLFGVPKIHLIFSGRQPFCGKF